MHYYLKWVLQCDSAYDMLGKDVGSFMIPTIHLANVPELYSMSIEGAWVYMYIWNGG